MNKIMIAAAVLAAAFLTQADVKHKFICVENGKEPNLVFVDQFEPSNSWKVKLPKGSRDICLLDNERVIVSKPSGAIIRSLKDGSVIKEIDGFKGVQSASLTQEGNILIGGPTQLAFVSASGDTIKKIEIKKVKHNRLARQLKNGNVVYAVNSYHLFEYDDSGRVVWEHKFSEKGYLAHEEQDGALLATRGHGLDVVKVTRDGKETLVAGGKEKHPDALFAWFSGFDVLDNQNIVVANWCGHGWKKEKIHLFEFDRDNNIVWQWKDDSVSQITTVQVIK